MAPRLRPMHQDDVRAKIQTSQLLNRLTDHALGNNNVKLETSQVRAIEVLLKKTLPDLSSVEMSGEGGGPLQVLILKPGEQAPDAD